MSAAIPLYVYSHPAAATDRLRGTLNGVSLVSSGTEVQLHVPVQIQAGPQSGSFRPDAYFAKLQTKSIGHTLLTTAEITSTQTLLHDNFTRFPDGTVCVADVQTSGKGRGKNVWTSPAGCLMFTLYKKLAISGERLPFVQYVVSMAIVDAIQAVIGSRMQGPASAVRIKWPNDLYCNGLKVGGILCQSVYREGAFHLVIGAGLNVSNKQPTTCIQTILEELSSQAGSSSNHQPISREEVLCATLNRLEELLDILAREGFAPLKAAYLEAWLHSNQQVTLEEVKDGVTSQIHLTITGISASGYMTAVDDRGSAFELHPDGNSLDFFQGLIRHKQVFA